MAEGVDYSFDRPDVTALWSAGKQFAGRYFGLGTNDKLASTTEIGALQAMGLSVFVLAEQWGDSALNGWSLGVQHANIVRADMDRKGVPDNRPAYFAVDFDVQPYQWAAVADYFNGVRSVMSISRTGIYGGLYAVRKAAEDGVASWFFQTYAWSGGQWFQLNHVEQYSNRHIIGGGEVDYCRSKQDDFGQWGGSLAPMPTPTPQSAPVISGESWDYVGDINATAADDAQLGTIFDSYARDLDGLRSY